MANVYITSSEISEYVYCPRAWWLRKNAQSPETAQMRQGSLAHDLLAVKLDNIGIRKVIILILILLIVVLLAALILSQIL